ncbi:hypothetical protein DL771_005400 [Monosporascus sp. 5C6A]|nr:hypothetical protein DL771_005400 [Monosporascus sp. 5C6A]
MDYHISGPSQSQQKEAAAETAQQPFFGSRGAPGLVNSLPLQPDATDNGTRPFLAGDVRQAITAEPEPGQFQISPEVMAQIQRQSVLVPPQQPTQKQIQIRTQTHQQQTTQGANTQPVAQNVRNGDPFYNTSSGPLPQKQPRQDATDPLTTGSMRPGPGGGQRGGIYDMLNGYKQMILEDQPNKDLVLGGYYEKNRRGRLSPLPSAVISSANYAPDAQAVEENKTSEDPSQIYYTISEDVIGASMRDKLSALETKSDLPQPATATGSPQPAKRDLKPALMQQNTAYYQRAFRGINGNPVGQAYARGQVSTMPLPGPQSWLPLVIGPQSGQQLRQLERPCTGNEDVQERQRKTAREHHCRSPANFSKSNSELDEPQMVSDRSVTPTPKIPFLAGTGAFHGHSTGEYESTERGFAQKQDSSSAPSFDSNLLQQMMQRIQELEAENANLRGDSSDNSAINVQVFHCLGGSGDENDETAYLSEPDWEIHGEDVVLRGRFPVSDPQGYVEKGNTAFIIYKHYTKEHQRSAIDEAVRAKKPLPNPEPASQDVMLISCEMIKAVKAFFAQYPTFRTEFPEVDEMERIKAPYIWWYHCRKSHNIQSLPRRQAQLVVTLTNWIEANYASLYDQINDQFRRGKVSNASMEYLVRPGHVLISQSDGVPLGHLATTRPYLIEKSKHSRSAGNVQHESKHQSSWGVHSRSYTYAGDFLRADAEITLNLETETEDGEVDVASLGVVPLEYASNEVQARLMCRGKIFWKCRNKQLVSYEGNSTNGEQAGQRFMIDFNTYKELHPFNSYSSKFTSASENGTNLPTDGSEPKAPEIYLFPTRVPGFDLRRKKWIDLEVDQIRDVTWNEQAFRSLVADEDMKEIILALVTNQLAAETATDLIDNKGNGLIMLLHGSPGTGKTFTAESVAEIAKKPLFPVTCGDIGTEPEAVEKYLGSVFRLGKIWDCVVLLDEAEVFLEQRTLQDLKRNALVSVFLRALEYYEGILILTTNRVGTFDEAFKSRIQLALRYEKLKDYQRKQIWRNFIDRLRALGEHDMIDFDDILLHTDELAGYPMNGRQIRNSITTGRQLAKFMKKKMTFTHLKRAITVAEKFDSYLASVREADVEECGRRGVDGRYSDEYFARSDQTR